MVKMAFIGCGGHSIKNLQPCIPLIGQIDYVAACDLDEDKAKYAARKFGAKTWYVDYEKMLEREEPDVVAVVGSPEMHVKLTLACLEFGVHVFVEKPPGVSSEECNSLRQAARRNAKFVMVGTMWRHGPAHANLKNIIESDVFGKPLHFEGHYFTPGPREPIWGLETVEKSYLLNQSIHPLDYMRFLMGDVTRVYATSARGQEGAVSFSVSLNFENGAVGTLNMLSGAPCLQSIIIVMGDGNHVAEVHNMRQLRHFKSKPKYDIPVSFKEITQGDYYYGHGRPGYLEELEHLSSSILAGKQPQASIDDAYQTMLILEAIDESRKRGEPIEIKSRL